MPAKAAGAAPAIHALVALTVQTPKAPGQKFFAERRPREGLFFKKATAFFSMANA
jgi:hypothetical protein